ncbi:hypothetical protein RI543_003981 [Arxiozyma heterogenica]|uniref:Uncharacterized protein n=1 Tax=Arxiozyma heterogenica TaxID=278026 RepID=A0AAN8A699_9SACH|nr:hypothetical protein RI543_003981 [Kazachstania heterogenica]
MGELKDISHYGPSLCVKFFEETTLYSACGPFLQIFDYKTNILKHHVRIFKKNKIHGFSFSNNGNSIVLYGGKSVLIIETKSLLASDNVSDREFLASEWIITGEFSYNNNQIYLLTCYNLVLVLDINATILYRKTLKNERSILYSGSIRVLSDTVYVCSGTVMGGVLIWDLHSESMIHNLVGHDGSIFYVTVSNNAKLIASCSDDRSIRLWDMTTGEQLAVGWGHTARIWNLRFFHDDTKLISVSEDCTCRTWNINLDPGRNKVELLINHVFEVHLIKNVWSVDVKEDEMIAVTSGNDGRLKLIDLQQSNRYGDEHETFDLKDIGKTFNVTINKDEIIKGFTWLPFGLVSITSYGKIFLYYYLTKQWKLLEIDERFMSYSITNSIGDQKDNNIVVFSNNKCDLLLLNLSKDGNYVTCKESLHIDGLSKTTNCMIIPSSQETFLLTLESPNPRDSFKILKFNMNSLQIQEEYNFKKPENFTSSCLEIFNHYLLVGSRFSTIAIFDLNKANDTNYICTLIKRINPGDTTTSIKLIESKNNKQLFSVTNRDGYYNFITLTLTGTQKIRHEIIHSNKILKGFLEGAYYNNSNDYIIYGFKSSLFYMYNEQKGYEIVSEVCGGAHRQWKLSSLFDNTSCNNSFMLMYIKSSKLYLRKIYKPVVAETLIDGLHGREIRDLSICLAPRKNSDHLFVTGSEDTTIRLNSVNLTTGNIKTYWAERRHVSGLQKLRFINSQLIISCSAREELFLWEINDEFDSNPYIYVKQTLPVSSNNPDLRIMDFDVKFINEEDFMLHTVYSDSAVKIWYYQKKSNTFKLITCMKYKTCCIFNTLFVDYNDFSYLVLAPTDGYLVIYSVTEIVKCIQEGFTTIKDVNLIPELSIKVHKSGIKCIDKYVNKDNQLEIYTGGDDNGVGITKFEIEKTTGKLACVSMSVVPDIASSTVTSCKVFNDGLKLLTTSVDQIIRVWDTSNKNTLRLYDCKYTTIADTGCCDILTMNGGLNVALIAGVGLSVWSL